jgi:hypothetical protein
MIGHALTARAGAVFGIIDFEMVKSCPSQIQEHIREWLESQT